MSNRQTFPASLFPLRGDLSAEAGATTVVVTGIRSIPVTTVAPTAGQSLIYDAVTNTLIWVTASGILINGLPSSSSKQVFINGVTDGSTLFVIEINGTPDGG